MSHRIESPIAPDFALPDTDGNVIRLSDYRERKHVVLVFTRGFT